MQPQQRVAGDVAGHVDETAVWIYEEHEMFLAGDPQRLLASGTLSIAGTQIRSLDVSVDMTSLRSDVGGRDETMRSQGLQTDRFPESRFHLSEPLVIGQPSRGEVITASIRGDLTLHGQTHAVTIPIQARWDGPTIEVAGASRIRLADFGIDVSGLPGFKIESGGTIEFELTLSRSDSSAGGPGDTIVANPQTQTGEPTDQPCAATGQAPALPAALLFTAFPGDGVSRCGSLDPVQSPPIGSWPMRPTLLGRLMRPTSCTSHRHAVKNLRSW